MAHIFKQQPPDLSFSDTISGLDHHGPRRMQFLREKTNWVDSRINYTLQKIPHLKSCQVTQEMTFLSWKVIVTVNAATFRYCRLSHLKCISFPLSQILKMPDPWRIYLLRYGIGRNSFWSCIDPDVSFPELLRRYLLKYYIAWLEFDFVDMIGGWPSVECSEEWIGIDWLRLCLAWWIVVRP